MLKYLSFLILILLLTACSSNGTVDLQLHRNQGNIIYHLYEPEDLTELMEVCANQDVGLLGCAYWNVGICVIHSMNNTCTIAHETMHCVLGDFHPNKKDESCGPGLASY